MNKIYKVIWSKAKHCYVVVSEIAKRSGKSACNGVVKAAKLSALSAVIAASLAAGVSPMTADAAIQPSFAAVQPTEYVAINGVKASDNYSAKSLQFVDDQGRTTTVTYYVNKGYNVIAGNFNKFTDLSENGRMFIIVPEKDLSNEMNTTSSIIYSTGQKTNLEEGINSIDPGVYVAASNSNGTLADKTYQYIIYDPEYKGNATTYNNGWADVKTITKADSEGKTGINAGFKPVTWNSELGTYMYKGEVVDFNHVYCLTDTSTNPDTDIVGVFLNADGTVYTGSVYGYHNEILKTARISAYYTYSNANNGQFVHNKTNGQYEDYIAGKTYNTTDYTFNNGHVQRYTRAHATADTPGAVESHDYKTFWATEASDVNATLEDYTIAQYQADMESLVNNDIALLHNDIKEGKLENIDIDKNGKEGATGTYTLYRNGIHAIDHPTVDGAMTFTANGGSAGKDTNVTITSSNTDDKGNVTTNTLVLPTGSVVKGDSTTALTKVTINGIEHTIKDNDTTYTAGTNIAIDANNKISATDTNTKNKSAAATLTGKTLTVSVTDTDNKTVTTNSVDLSSIDTNTKNKSAAATLTGKTLTVSVTDTDNKTVTTNSVDLSSIDTDTTYTAGTNVQISDKNVISATDTNTKNTSAAATLTGKTLTVSVKDSDNNTVTTNSVDLSSIDTDTTYTAGTNVQISDKNVISATDTNTKNTSAVATLTGKTLTVSVTDTDNNTVTTNSVDLSSIDTDTQYTAAQQTTNAGNNYNSGSTKFTVSEKKTGTKIGSITLNAGENVKITGDESGATISARDTTLSDVTLTDKGDGTSELTVSDTAGTSKSVFLKNVTDTNTTYAFTQEVLSEADKNSGVVSKITVTDNVTKDKDGNPETLATFVDTDTDTTYTAGKNITIDDKDGNKISTSDKVEFTEVNVTKEFKAGDTIINEGGVTTNNIQVVEGDKITNITGDKITLGDTIIEGDNITTTTINGDTINSTTINGDTINTETINLGDNITIQEGDKNNITYTTQEGDTIKTYHIATVEDGLNFKGDAGEVIHKELKETLEIVGGATDEASETNIHTSGGKDGKLHINLAKDIKGVETVEVTNNITVGEGDNITNITGDKITLGDTIIEGDKVTVGDTIINNEGLTINNGPTFTKTEVNVGGNKITNVYEGDSDTDAVNLAQVKRLAAVASDNRNVGVYKDKNDKQTIVSPYLQVEGVGDASAAKQNVEIVDSYATKKEALEAQKTNLDPDKDKDAIAKIDGKLQALEDAYTAANADIEADREILKAFAQAMGTDSIAMGSGSKAAADYSVAIGKGAEVTKDVTSGIALGSGSVANRGAGVTGANPFDVPFDKNSPAWTSTAGEVSVGNVQYNDKGEVQPGSVTRQITGVAAGTKPTDAVNMAQLLGSSVHYYSVNETIPESDEVTGEGTNYDNKGAAGAGSLAAGLYANAKGEEATAFGYNSQAKDTSASAIGSSSEAVAQFATAIGNRSVAMKEEATAIGSQSKADGIQSTATGYKAVAMADNSTAYGVSSTAGGVNSTAVGLDANSFGRGSIAIGHETTSGALVYITDDKEDGQGATTVDETAKMYKADIMRGGDKDQYVFRKTTDGVIVAYNTVDHNYYNTGDAVMKDGVVVGYEIESVNSNITDSNVSMGGISMGSYAHAEGDRSLAIGRVSGAYGQNSTAMGIYANAAGDGSLAIGHGSSTGVKAAINKGGADDFWSTTLETDKSGNPVLIVNEDKDGNKIQADGGIAIGSYAHTEGTRALAVGRVASAYGTNSTAIGLRSNAYGEGSIAFGHGVVAGSDAVVKDKDGNLIDNKYATQVEALHNDPSIPYDLDGSDGIVDPANVVGAVAIGSYAEATGRGSLSVGRYSQAKSAYSTTLGIRAAVADSAENAVAIGRESKVETLEKDRPYGGMNSIAIGTLANVKGRNSIAIGSADMLEETEDGVTVVAEDKRKPTSVKGDNSIAIGMNDTVEGTNSIAIGTGHTVIGSGSGAIGDPSIINGDNSYAVGNNNNIAVNDGFILGNNASVTEESGVALGSYSVAGRGVSTGGYNPTSGARDYTDGSAAWESTYAAVSVGNVQYNEKGEMLDGAITRQITGVAAGTEDTDAVNVAQLKLVNAVASAHTTVTVDGSEIGKDVTEGNLLLTVTPNEAGGDNYDLKLSDDITIGGLGKDGKDGKDGHIGVDGADGKSGVGIDGKDGITVYGKDGKDGAPAVAINGKDGVGTIGLAGRDGTNGKDGTNVVDIQVGPGGEPGLDGKDGITRIIYEDKDGEHEVATLDDGLKFGGDMGDPSQVKLNKQVNIVGGVTSEEDLTDGNIGVVSSQDGENGKLEIKLSKDLKDLETIEVTKNITVGDNITIDGDNTNITVGDTTINNDGLTINGGPTITKTEVNVAGNRITNVAIGVDATDAVNMSQLTEVKNIASAHNTVTVDGSEIGEDVTEGNLLLTVTPNEAGGDNYDLKLSDDITIGGLGKDGKDGKDGHIGVDGADGKSGVGIDGKDGITVYGKDGKDGAPAVAINGKDGVGTIGLAGRDGTNGKDGTSVVDIQVGPGGEPGLDGKDGITRIIYEDKDGEHEVATLDDGMKYGGDFGEVSQVKLNKQVNIVGGAASEADLTDGNIGVVSSQDGENGKLEIKLNKDLQNIETIQVNKNITVGDNITIDGDTTNITVGDTVIDNSSVTTNEVKAGDTVINEGGITTNNIETKNINVTENITYKGDPIVTDVTYEYDSNTLYVNKGDTVNEYVLKGTVYEGDNKTINISEDNVISVIEGNVAEGDKGVVTGDTVYNEVRVKKDGNYIRKDNTAAENITALDDKVYENSQNIENLGNAINNTNNQINGLDNRMKKGLAGAAALAALHPMDFNPDDKLQFSAGIGNYRGETAAAVGAFYRPDESVMFSVGGTFGNADNMVNAGITFGLDGTRNRITRSRTAMAREIQDLRSLVTQMAARMDRMEAANGIETAMFPDVPENHWAYEYVEDLQKRGALKGYPDGLFKGDRSMTRYEFAAMLDRIVRSGVTLDSKIAKEFEPELGRIYVERISGQDNDRKKIERVRVNNSDSKYPEGKTRDVYGSKIQPVVSEKAAGE